MSSAIDRTPRPFSYSRRGCQVGCRSFEFLVPTGLADWLEATTHEKQDQDRCQRGPRSDRSEIRALPGPCGSVTGRAAAILDQNITRRHAGIEEAARPAPSAQYALVEPTLTTTSTRERTGYRMPASPCATAWSPCTTRAKAVGVIRSGRSSGVWYSA